MQLHPGLSNVPSPNHPTTHPHTTANAQDPVRTNKIPRQVPPQPSYLHPVLSVLVGGVLPFGAVFIELFFLMSSMWQNQFYYLFGFLALVALILVATCAEISIVFAYFQLCAEDYRWHWRSFLVSASSALYLYAYAVVYFVTRLDITKLVPMVLYFGTRGMACVCWLQQSKGGCACARPACPCRPSSTLAPSMPSRTSRPTGVPPPCPLSRQDTWRWCRAGLR